MAEHLQTLEEILKQKEEIDELLKQKREEVLRYEAARDEERRLRQEAAQLSRMIESISNKKSEKKHYICTAQDSRLKGVIAFRIDRVLPAPNEKYALCLCVTSHDAIDMFSSYAYGVRRMVLPLWYPATMSLVTREDDELFIDHYVEINKEGFEDVLNQTLSSLLDKTDKKA